SPSRPVPVSMKLKPDAPALTVLLAALVGISPLSTDMYLPSLPSIATDFDTGAAQVQMTLTAYLVGFSLGQILYGPIADRIGRRPVLLAGLAAFVLASALCALAPTIEVLIAARFIQSVA